MSPNPFRNSRHRIAAATVAALMLAALPASAHERETDRMAGALAADLTASDAEIAAVVDFTDLQGNVTELGRFLAEELSIALASQAERLRVIDRTHLKVLLEEHKLSSTGLIDPETARELGRIAGVGALITGTVSPLGESVRLTIKALDTETAQIVTSTASNIERTQAISDLLRRGITAGGGSEGPGAGESIAPEETAEAEGFHFRLKRCEVSSQKLVCRFLVTNQQEDRLFYLHRHSRVITPSGDQYDSSLHRYGSDSGEFLFEPAPRGVPVKAAVVFPGVPTDVRRLALLEINCKQFTVQFRNVPVYSK